MIGKINGTVSEIDGNVALVATKTGLSYEVLFTPTLLSKYQPGSDVELYTYHQVREDAQILFGFVTRGEKELFKGLISVSGVGPKTAYSIVSFSEEADLFQAVRENDVDFFSKVPGLGKKTAMKIILDLSQKFKSEFSLEKMYLSEDDKTVVDALVSLGYKNKEAKQVLSKIPKNLSLEEKIKHGLKYAAPTTK